MTKLGKLLGLSEALTNGSCIGWEGTKQCLELVVVVFGPPYLGLAEMATARRDSHAPRSEADKKDPNFQGFPSYVSEQESLGGRPIIDHESSGLFHQASDFTGVHDLLSG
jgi:hypothetical protein